MTEHHGPIIDQKGNYSVIECEKCKYKHLDPIPDEDDLRHFYQNQYYQVHKADYIQTDIQEELYQNIAFKERLLSIARFTEGKKILDVGCGSGKFLEYAAKTGWDCKGVEPSPHAAEHAHSLGLDVFVGPFEDFPPPSEAEQFDVIQFKNVLEHVRDPATYIQIARRLLKPGGILYVEVPNDFDFIQEVGIKRVGTHRSWISVPDHINYFNFKTLKILMRQNYFEILRRDTTFPMYFFLWLGMNFIQNREEGKKAHKLRMKFEIWCEKIGFPFLRRALYRGLAFLGTGRTVILYCRKI